MDNTLHILQSFEKNTDAAATNQGFYYQYLATLDKWLDIRETESCIYCETEDDIKIEDKKNNTIEFTQVKAYASSFAFNSIEVKKSIANFFILYLKYKEKNNLIFYFSTNSSATTKDVFFINWPKRKSDLNSQNECVKQIKSALCDFFEEDKNKKKNKFTESSKKDSSKKAENKTKEDELEKSFANLIDEVKKESSSFADKIDFVFENISKNRALLSITDSILKKIESVAEFSIDKDYAFGNLLHKVLFASQSSEIGARKLDKSVFNDLVEKARDKHGFRKSLQSAELLPKFMEICKYHDIQIEALNRVENRLKELIEISKETNENSKELIEISKEQIAISKDTNIKFNEFRENSKFKPNLDDFSEYYKNTLQFKVEEYQSVALNITTELTPQKLFDIIECELFFPKKPSREAAKNVFSDQTINDALWKNWLIFLCIIDISGGNRKDIPNICMDIAIKHSSTLILPYNVLFDNKITSNFYFKYVDDNDFRNVAALYLKNTSKYFNKHTCYILHTHHHHFVDDHFTFRDKEKIIKSIAGNSSNKIMENIEFGILNFDKLVEQLKKIEAKSDFETAFKQILKDAIETKTDR